MQGFSNIDIAFYSERGTEMTVKIITDSACDLPDNLIEENDIEVIPLLVQLDGKELVDGKDICPEQVYAAIREGKTPRTSQTPAQIFIQVFQKFIDLGRQCIYIAFSSKLSGTCQTGMMVAQDLNEQNSEPCIEVVDTLCGSMGQGLLVLEAAKLAKDGKPVPEIADRIKRQAPHMEHIFTVDDLDYLYRGGRVSRTSAFVGSLLKIKPLLHVKEGLMVPFQKVRGKNKAIMRLVEIMGEKCSKLGQTIGISHADDPEAAMLLKNLIEKTFGFKDIVVNVVGSVLGCHIGLGGVAVFFLNNSYQPA
jgi:DegV family protein with EDD domain